MFSSWMRTCCYMSIAYKLMLTWVTTYNVIRPYCWSKAHTNSFIVTYWLIRSRSTSSTSTRSKKGSEAKPFRPGCIPQSSCMKVIKLLLLYSCLSWNIYKLNWQLLHCHFTPQIIIILTKHLVFLVWLKWISNFPVPRQIQDLV